MEKNLKSFSYHRGEKHIPFEEVYVAHNWTDTADSINAKLIEGKHVVF